MLGVYRMIWYTVRPWAPSLRMYYSNAVLTGHPDAGIVKNVSALGFVTLALKCFLRTAEKFAVRYECNALQVGHGGCGAIVPLLSGVCRRIGYQGVNSLVADCAFDSALAFIAYQQVAGKRLVAAKSA